MILSIQPIAFTQECAIKSIFQHYLAKSLINIFLEDIKLNELKILHKHIIPHINVKIGFKGKK